MVIESNCAVLNGGDSFRGVLQNTASFFPKTTVVRKWPQNSGHPSKPPILKLWDANCKLSAWGRKKKSKHGKLGHELYPWFMNWRPVSVVSKAAQRIWAKIIFFSLSLDNSLSISSSVCVSGKIPLYLLMYLLHLFLYTPVLYQLRAVYQIKQE